MEKEDLNKTQIIFLMKNLIILKTLYYQTYRRNKTAA